MAAPGMVVKRHPNGSHPSAMGPEHHVDVEVRHRSADHLVIGNGPSGQAAAAAARNDGSDVLVLDAHEGNEVVAVFDGPTVIVRTPTGVEHFHAHHITLATGAAEVDRKSTRLNSSHSQQSRMPSSA